MTLDETQRKTVATWIEQGMKLSDIQSRLDKEMGARLTYMEVRFLVDDLKLMPKDPVQPPKPPAPEAPAPAAIPAGAVPEDAIPADAGEVVVTVDQIARAGAMISGGVTFSDGKTAEWLIDQMGRPRLVAKEAGYRPSQEDLMAFQAQLEVQLSKMGF